VQAGQHRPLERPLELDPLSVHRHSSSPLRTPSASSAPNSVTAPPAIAGQHEHRPERREPDPHHAAAAVAVDRRARQPRAGQQPERQADERRRELAVAQLERLLDRREPRRPGARDRRVDEERNREPLRGV
jgi:hypothetical protein